MARDTIDSLVEDILTLSEEIKKPNRGEKLSPRYPSSDLEKRLGEVVLQKEERASELRDDMYAFLKWFLIIQSVVILLLVVFQGFGRFGFRLNDIIFYILIGGFPVETYLLVKIVCEYLFPRE